MSVFEWMEDFTNPTTGYNDRWGPFTLNDVPYERAVDYIEAEINELESVLDRQEFLKEIGLEEPGVNRIINSAYALLGLHTFFTAGEKEVRAWTIKKGALAPQAAGVIHTDFEKGFIRAEVIAFDDRMQFKTEQACREAGKISIEGKNYEVRDGDVIHFRFNV